MIPKYLHSLWILAEITSANVPQRHVSGDLLRGKQCFPNLGSIDNSTGHGYNTNMDMGYINSFVGKEGTTIDIEIHINKK